jgi:hypothetical protein
VLALLSAIVALGCMVASGRRLAWVVAPSSFDAATFLDGLEAGGAPTLAALREAMLSRPDLGWEHDVASALIEEPARRDALLEEQVLELDWNAQRWARVPRVCASIATSAGFLFASIALLRGLELPATDDAQPALGAALVSALNALSVGIAGTSFCVAVHLRTRRLAAQRIRAGERLIERLRVLATGYPRVADAAR